MDKIIQFQKINREKIIKQYELEDYDKELIDLAGKLIGCNPGRSADKKKEALKSEFLKKAADYRSATQQFQELTDDELGAAAGGLLHPDEKIKDPLKD